MIIRTFKAGGDFIFTDVDVLNDFAYEYSQQVEYTRVLGGRMHALNYGQKYDKWRSSITIQSDKQDMEFISSLFTTNVDFIELYPEDGKNELIFGPGIDYSIGPSLIARVENASRPFSQENIALSQIKLDLSCRTYGGVAGDAFLQFKSSIPAGLPDCLNFQSPVDRRINRRESVSLSQEYSQSTVGEYSLTEVGESADPINWYDISVVFDQNEEEAAQIEKFVSNQRSTPFVFPGLSELYLYPGQSATTPEEVMITGFVATRVGYDRWRVTLKMVTNV